jgi:hypothetical protein
MTDNKQTTKTNNAGQKPQRRPNETGSISVQGHVRISVPLTKQIFVEKRA